MATLLITFFALVCLGMVLWGLMKKGRIYQFPFLSGVTWAAFALPQLIGLRHDPFLPPGSLEKTCLMILLCASFGWLGYASARRPFKGPAWTFSSGGLNRLGLVLSLFGAYFFFLISRLPQEMTGERQWSGLPVAYLFFAHILTYGFALSTFAWASTRSAFSLGLALFGAAFYLDRILLAGRRGDTLEFTFIILTALWFFRGRQLPRGVMLAGVLLGTLMLHSTGEYRTTVLEEKKFTVHDVLSIPFVANLRQILSQGGEELRNAAYQIHSADFHNSFDFGAFHWNGLVFNYVPQQLVGKSVKEALTVKTGVESTAEFGFEAIPGATATGATDAFLSFWYFGCLKFFLIGWFMKRLWLSAMAGLFFHRLAYALVLAASLHTVTHHTQWFVTPWVHMALFLLPALMMARTKAAPDAALRSAA